MSNFDSQLFQNGFVRSASCLWDSLKIFRHLIISKACILLPIDSTVVRVFSASLLLGKSTFLGVVSQ